MEIVLPYVGSKKRILSLIVPNIGKPNLYIEPFSGGFSLGLDLIEQGLVSKAILNDLDPQVTTFWSCIKTDYWSIVTAIDTLVLLHSANFNKLSNFEINQLFEDTVIDDFTASALFYIRRKMNRGKSTSYLNDRLSFGNAQYTDVFMKASILLTTALVTNASYSELECYNLSGTFWYLDPPYYQHEGFYNGEEGKSFNHIGLRNFCRDLKGSFILSYDDCTYIRDLYTDFYIYPIKVPSSMSYLGYSEELLISNIELILPDLGLPQVGKPKVFQDVGFQKVLTISDLLNEEV
jgi:DNA adenine methylase